MIRSKNQMIDLNKTWTVIAKNISEEQSLQS